MIEYIESSILQLSIVLSASVDVAHEISIFILPQALPRSGIVC